MTFCKQLKKELEKCKKNKHCFSEIRLPSNKKYNLLDFSHTQELIDLWAKETAITLKKIPSEILYTK